MSEETNSKLIVSYYNILWASIDDENIVIRYADSRGKNDLKPTLTRYSLEHASVEVVKAWIQRLLDLAYDKAIKRKRMKILINPHSGQGRAQQLYRRDIAPIFDAAGCQLDVEITKYVGHAKEIAKTIDSDLWDVIACASGDGTPHEVFNGLAEQEHPQKALAKIAVVLLPCGSGNAMSWNLYDTGSPSMAALAIVKGLKTPLDLISITQGNRRYLSFLSQSLGIVAESDLGTDNIRWMGPARFEIGFLLRLLGKTTYPVELWLGVETEDKSTIQQRFLQQANEHFERPSVSTMDELPPLQFGTVRDPVPADWKHIDYPNLGNFYAGNMPFMAPDANFFPYAQPCDGTLDLLTIDGDIPRRRALHLATSVKNGTLFDQSEAFFRKIKGYRIIPKAKQGYISIDGEAMPWEGFQAEIHRGLGTVLSKSVSIYERQSKDLSI